MQTPKIQAGARIKFGTDGWRAIIGDGFTFDNLERVSQAFAGYLCSLKHNPPKAVIGFDNRFLSERFAMRVAEVLAGNDVDVRLFREPVPTPLVSFAVKETGSSAGVMITASHNPAIYNGFKIKAPWGGSATDEITQQVEQRLDSQPVKRAEAKSFPEPDVEITTAYRNQIAGLVDIEKIRASDLKVIVDSMHGTGGLIAESFLTGARVMVETIRSNRDCLFGGIAPEPIDRNLQMLKDSVKEKGAAIGIATDGDADRLGAVDELGSTMTMHDVVPILLMHMVKHKGGSGNVVFTVSQSVLLKRVCQSLGIPWTETPVGFKYIANKMLEGDVLIGAEESGGIGIKGHLPERDGILNGLLLLEAIVSFGKMPSEIVRDLHNEFGEFYYERRDMHVLPEAGKKMVATLAKSPPSSLAGDSVAEVNTMDGLKLVVSDGSWLMLRQSGTEPVLRLYSEGTSRQKAVDLLKEAETVLLPSFSS